MSRNDTIVDMYKVGLNMQEIADVFELTRGRVSQILKLKGVAARPRSQSTVYKNEIKVDAEVDYLVRVGIKPIEISRMANIPHADAVRQKRKLVRLNQLRRKSD
jgi:hemerythrin superfamily protein